MKNQLTINQTTSAYNATVKQFYFQILKQARALLATIEEEPLRYTLIREDKQPIAPGTIIHELVNPLIYLRLECYAENTFGIHYGYEASPTFSPYYHVTNSFIRMLYTLTMVSNTTLNIENCIHTDWIITNCSEMYEYIEERNKHHTFKLINYKPKSVKRKLRKVA